MAETAEKTQSVFCQNTLAAPEMYLRPFIPRKGTQRHCDHLDKLQPVKCKSRERRIESHEVALFLAAVFLEDATHGYWVVDGRSSSGNEWTAIACCETFELLVQCPPGQTIT